MSFRVYLDTMTFPHRALETDEENFISYHLDDNAPSIHNTNSSDWAGERVDSIVLFFKDFHVFRRYGAVKQSHSSIHLRIG